MSSDREYMRKYMLQRYHRRRAEVINRLGGKCAACDASEDLQIDHIDPRQKKVSWKQLSGMSKAKVEEEIPKCQLLCSSCHTDKTLKDLGRKRATHGSVAMYQHHKCRCELCKEAQSKSHRAYRERKKKGRKHQGDAPAS